MTALREMMGRLKLTVNEEKTRLCRVPESSFHFLGYTFGRCYSEKSGRSYIGTRPSKKSIAKVRRTSKAYRAIDAHVVERLRRWLCKKHQMPGLGTARFPDEHLYQKLGLKRLALTTRNLPWAQA